MNIVIEENYSSVDSKISHYTVYCVVLQLCKHKKNTAILHIGDITRKRKTLNVVEINIVNQKLYKLKTRICRCHCTVV